jgi:uncharacterized protein (DUF2236 family)
LPDARAGTGTVAWKLQREIVLLLAWGPAILLQLAHPLVARGVTDHSAFRAERRGGLRRFHRTLGAMLRLSFGTEREALDAVARINAIHDRVHGALPGPAGIFPAGAPYSARDPALLAWVHATLVDRNLRVYEMFVDRLSLPDQDRYCSEASAIEEHLGMPGGHLPRTRAALDRYMAGMLASGEIAVSGAARSLARDILYPDALRVAAPAAALMRLTTLGLLPPAIRTDYGFSWSSRQDAWLRRCAGLVRALLPLTPSLLRHWPAARASRRRASVSSCPLSGFGRSRV